MKRKAIIIIATSMLAACGVGRSATDATTATELSSPETAPEARPDHSGTNAENSVTTSSGSPSSTSMPTDAAMSTLTLHVSNQSFADDPVHITISIGNDVVVDEDFYVEGQHNWITFELNVPPGDHPIEMTSSTGLRQSATLTMPADNAHRWAVVDYWYYADDPQTPRAFSFRVDDEPINFA